MADKNIDAFDSFYNSLEERMKGDSLVTDMNQDRIHNAAIMKLMLDHGGRINMFCGSMSVFRNDFYKHIELLSKDIDADAVKSKMRESLGRYLNDADNTLDVVLENGDDNLFDDMIIDRCQAASAVKRGTLRILKLDDNFFWRDQLHHFCYSPDSTIVRTETNKQSHEGVFVAKDKETVQNADTTFEMLKDYAVAL